MKPYEGLCIECNQDKWIHNSRRICPDCVFRKSHDGKSKSEVNFERQKMRQKEKHKQIYKPKRKPLKSSKNRQKAIEKRKAVLAKDREMYFYWFSNKEQVCEECGQVLPDVFEEDGSIVCIARYSHILTKGAYPEFRYHKLNCNILCPHCHDRWEFGDRETMNIYKPNQDVVQKIRETPNNLI